MGNPTIYLAKDMILAKIDTWKQQQMIYNPQYEPEETLSFVKECCEEYDLDLKVVKEIFDEVEDPYYYDIDEDDIDKDDSECGDSDDEEEDWEDWMKKECKNCFNKVSKIGWSKGDAPREYCEECYIKDQEEDEEED